MRRAILSILLLAPVVSAKDTGLFAPPSPNAFGDNQVPGAFARFAESLAIAKDRLAKNPSDAAALDAVADELILLDRVKALQVEAEKILYTPNLSPERAALAHRVAGHALVVQGEQEAENGFYVIRNNRPVRQGPDGGKYFAAAVPHLRAAIEANAEDARSRMELARALEGKGDAESKEEIRRLRLLAGGIFLKREIAPEGFAAQDVLAGRASELLDRASDLELRTHPDHVAARRLREEALVFQFCGGARPFPYDPTLYAPVSVLADSSQLHECLTQHWRPSSSPDSQEDVPARAHPPSDASVDAALEALAGRDDDGAGAVLLQAIVNAPVQEGTADRAVRIVSAARPKGVGPRLVDALRRAFTRWQKAERETLSQGGVSVQFGQGAQVIRVNANGVARRFGGFGTIDADAALGCRRLLALAGTLQLREAAPLLRRALPYDRDLALPLGVAAALARVGSAEDADALLAIAADKNRDVYFRRRAVDALAALAPARLADLPPDPLLAVSLAAARTVPARTVPGMRAPDAADVAAARTLLISKLSSPHEADDAAAYCARLGLKEAVPALERALAAGTSDDPAALRAALDKLR